MTVRITAKARCEGNSPSDYPPDTHRVSFAPDYQDGRNKEWAAATPTLQITLGMQSSVAENFVVGDKYTVTFEKTED
jgi:hypothetical protein